MASNWFAENQPPQSGSMGTPVPQGAQQPQGDPKTIAMQYAQSLGPPSDENIQKTADYMKSLGFNVQANPGSDGFFINGVGVDMVSNYKGSGPKNWQWLPDSPGGSLGNMGDPSGFQTGTFTGGGKYPLASVMGTGLAQPWTTPFVAPNDITEQNDPGFQARLKMGTDALQRSAASKGTLLTGGLLKGLDRYAQDYASNEFGNVYGRALGEYNLARGIYGDNQSTLYNRLGQMANVGENAAAGTGSMYQDIGNARAGATMVGGNAYANAATNTGNTVGQIFAYQNQNPYGPPSNNPYGMSAAQQAEASSGYPTRASG